MADCKRYSFSAPEVSTRKSAYTSTGDHFQFDSDADVLFIDAERQEIEGEDEYDPVKLPEFQSDLQSTSSGILNDETLNLGVSNLQPTPDGRSLAYVDLHLPGHNLSDVSILESQIHLHRLALPWNCLSDLWALHAMTQLCVLDVSHNNLTTLLDFPPPKGLREVDYSYNEIGEISNLTHHPHIHTLLLSNNNIKEMKDLYNCLALSTLDLSHNDISNITGLGQLPIKYLNLSSNHISELTGLEKLHLLQTLNLSGNRVRSLSGLEGHIYLHDLDLEDNEIIDLLELKFVSKCAILRNLNLLRNPIQELPDCWQSILYTLPQLATLDHRKVNAEDKVSGLNMYQPPKEVVAARDHVMNTVFRFFQPAQIWESTLANLETPYPMLVLVGPSGSGKKLMCKKLIDEFPSYFGFGISHTTRKPQPNETDGKEYFFINQDQFESDTKEGQFVQTCKRLNHWYGLQMRSIEMVAKQGLATVVHMELEGMLSLMKSHFEPRYILLLPTEPTVHEKRLRMSETRSESAIGYHLRRVNMYAEYNRNNPGRFDVVIVSNNVSDTYHNLRHLVLEYLGMPCEPQSADRVHLEEHAKHPKTPSTYTGMPTHDSFQTSRLLTGQSKQGCVRENSLNRRHREASAIVSGQVSELYDTLVRSAGRSPRTAHGSTSEFTDSSAMNKLLTSEITGYIDELGGFIAAVPSEAFSDMHHQTTPIDSLICTSDEIVGETASTDLTLTLTICEKASSDLAASKNRVLPPIKGK